MVREMKNAEINYCSLLCHFRLSKIRVNFVKKVTCMQSCESMNEFCGSRIGGKVIPDVGNNLNCKSEG